MEQQQQAEKALCPSADHQGGSRRLVGEELVLVQQRQQELPLAGRLALLPQSRLLDEMETDINTICSERFGHKECKVLMQKSTANVCNPTIPKSSNTAPFLIQALRQKKNLFNTF